MRYVDCNLQNCYGIEKFNHKFDFSKSNAITIYAKNGLMKTSFAKTFKKIQEGKANDVRDEIFGLDSEIEIKIDGKDINKDDIFVINSFENYYESDSLSDLLVDEETKSYITDLIKLKNKFFKKLENYSGLKIQRTLQGKKVFELEPTIISDMKFHEDSFLLNLVELDKAINTTFLPNITYSEIFDSSVIKKIKDRDFQDKINDFCKASDAVYESYKFFEKGTFTFPKLKNVAKDLQNEKFFVNNNKLILNNTLNMCSYDDLQNKIIEIEEKIKKVPEFKQIEKLLSDSKGIILRDAIENNPEIIEFLKTENIELLKKELWTSYIKKERKLFDELLLAYNKFEKKIQNLNIDDTTWNKALSIFEDRFTVPYKMRISNLKAAVIGETLPRVEFEFEKDGQTVTIDRPNLEKLDILSRGEKRSLYLLNIIFDIENLKEEGRDILFIVDDIADSFDYKNKYAIVEYLYEMAQNDNFRLIVLSHNFDFYRTVSSRLDLPRESRFIIESKENLSLIEGKYQKKPFLSWKENPDKNTVFALIPFVRNLIEYSYDKKANASEYFNTDYELLTSLLHSKDGSKYITFKDLYKIYEGYFDKFKVPEVFNNEDYVIDKLYETADEVDETKNNLEHKIMLAMACRLTAEEVITEKIKQHGNKLTWLIKNREITGTSDEFLEYANSTNNRTRVLSKCYEQIAGDEEIKIINEVNIMTPENIHINSFMYEPIMDMDINELLNLYNKIKMLK